MEEKKDEWDIREDMNPPKNLSRAVKADMRKFAKKILNSPEYNRLSKKDKASMEGWLPSVIVTGYMMVIMMSAIQEYSKGNKKVRRKRK
jgi:hypothetical protein